MSEVKDVKVIKEIKEPIIAKGIKKPLPVKEIKNKNDFTTKLKENLDYKKKQMNGMALTEKILTMGNFVLKIAHELNNKEKSNESTKTLEELKDVTIEYMRDSIKRDKWNKLFILLNRLIVIVLGVNLGLLIVFLFEVLGYFEFNEMYQQWLIGLIGGMFSLLALTFGGLLIALGINKKGGPIDGKK